MQIWCVCILLWALCVHVPLFIASAPSAATLILARSRTHTALWPKIIVLYCLPLLQDYHLSITLRQKWTDERLQYTQQNGNGLSNYLKLNLIVSRSITTYVKNKMKSMLKKLGLAADILILCLDA